MEKSDKKEFRIRKNYNDERLALFELRTKLFCAIMDREAINERVRIMSQTDKQMVRGAIILTYAGLISKVLSAFYRIPLQNITGDVGFYVYQQIYPFIGMMTMMMLYGLPQSIATMIIEQPQIKYYKQQLRLYLYTVSVGLFIMLYVLAPTLSEWMGDTSLVSSLRIAFLLLFIMPELALYRGFAQATGWMQSTAISQVLEQVIRVSVIIAGAVIVMGSGMSLYKIGHVASLGAILGGVAALIYFFFHHKKSKETYLSPKENDHQSKLSYKLIFKTLTVYSVVIAMNHMILLLLQWVDTFTLVELLKGQDMALIEAKTLKGILDRAQPLSQLGIVASSSIALALVPGLSYATKGRDNERFIRLSTTAYRFGLYLSAAATIGLMMLMPKVNLVLFTDTSGTKSLQLFVVAIIFTSLAIITASILQAAGKGRKVFMAIVSGIVVKYVANQLLVPPLLLQGAAVSTVFGALTIFVVNHHLLTRQLNQKIQVPLVSFVLSLTTLGVTVGGLDHLLSPYLFSQSRVYQLLYLLGIILIGIVVYSVTLIKTGAITTEEKELIYTRK